MSPGLPQAVGRPDADDVYAEVDALLEAAGLHREMPLAELAPPLRAALARVRDRLEERFWAGGDVTALVRARARALDAVLGHAWVAHLARHGDRLALVAVGGYGRGELHPWSDVDLLVLTERDRDQDCEAALERFLTFLWDIGLEVGHSVRTVSHCVQEARNDLTVITNLLEARPLAGDPRLLAAMEAAVAPEALWGSREFFLAKREEQAARHHKYHDAAYNLEPNVKEGPGALRDLQTISWSLQRHFGIRDFAELIEAGILTVGECEGLLAGRDMLWRVRFGLHAVAGRREDRLLFDHQRVLAGRFGYRDSGPRLAVEQFMKDYYRTVTELSRVGEMLMQLLEEIILRGDAPERIRPINTRFRDCNGYLEAAYPKVFEHYPFALLEVFLLLQQHPELEGVRATTIRLIRDHTHLLDAGLRSDIRCRALFLEILKQPRGLTATLRRMHRYGVLAAFLPSFGAIEGQMQHDLFHVYTVDEHTLAVVRNLRRFMVPECEHEFPLCSDIARNLPKPELLYLGGLFHDIAKGRGGDHSELGASEARSFCIQLGMSEWDASLVAWLVRSHLVMSTTAQRQDISDPEVIARFAALVGDRVHLNYLYVLTVADIRGTSPGLWNDWKDALLKELYRATLRALRRGRENPLDNLELVEETKDEAWVRLQLPESRHEQVRELWRHLHGDYFLRHSPDEISWQTRTVLETPREALPQVQVRERTHRGGTEVFVYAVDQDYLFATTTAALDQLGLTIADARIFTSDDGMALDTYIVLEQDGKPIVDPQRQEEITGLLRAQLAHPDAPPPPVGRRARRQLKHFPVDTEVAFRDEDATGRTVMEVTTGDRPGLLSRIAVAMARTDAHLRGAKVATFGERAEDIFFLTDGSGRPLGEAARQALVEAVKAEVDGD